VVEPAFNDPDTPIRDLPLAVLSAIAAGVGGLAFFTFVGGAITVARFRGAGLSGTKAVALVPKSDLLAVGAQALLLPTVIALIALAGFVPLAQHPWLRRVALVILGIGSLVALWAFTPYTPYWWIHTTDIFAALLAIAVAGGFAVDHLAKNSESRRPAQLGAPRRRASRSPAAVLLFLVVSLVVAVASYGVAYARPSVHAMAVLRSDGLPLCGVYVGESAHEVWVGEIKRDDTHPYRGIRASGYVAEVPRETVVALAIGSSLPIRQALQQMPRLLVELNHKIRSPSQRNADGDGPQIHCTSPLETPT
jgi:hypothetical protein